MREKKIIGRIIWIGVVLVVAAGVVFWGYRWWRERMIVGHPGGVKSQMKMFVSALEAYRISTDGYPDSELGLQALLVEPPGVNGWAGPYLIDPWIPRDPWNSAYIYEYPGRIHPDSFDLICIGRDRVRGSADDIVMSGLSQR